MKAAFYKGNGTFEIAENAQVNPGEGEVMLDVAFCGVCGTDVHIYHDIKIGRVKEGENDVVFEVSGSAAAVEAMTRLVNVRGRIVMVAIHGGEQKKIDLFKFFWSEIEMLGVRLYESDGYEEAIRIAASGSAPFDTLITRISNLSNIQNVLEEIDQNPEGMKYLINHQQ